MARIAVLGERMRVQGFGLAGALVVEAEDPDAVHTAWRSLPADVAVVILTLAAARALGGATDGSGLLVAVMPS